MDATASSGNTDQRFMRIACEVVLRTVRKVKVNRSEKNEKSVVGKHTVEGVCLNGAKISAPYYRRHRDHIRAQ